MQPNPWLASHYAAPNTSTAMPPAIQAPLPYAAAAHPALIVSGDSTPTPVPLNAPPTLAPTATQANPNDSDPLGAWPDAQWQNYLATVAAEIDRMPNATQDILGAARAYRQVVLGRIRQAQESTAPMHPGLLSADVTCVRIADMLIAKHMAPRPRRLF
jgi:hypothetical protein